MQRLFVNSGLDGELGIYELYKRALIEVERCLVELGVSTGYSLLEDRDERLGYGFVRTTDLHPHGRLVATVLERDQCIFYEIRVPGLDDNIYAALTTIAGELQLKYYDVLAAASEADDFIAAGSLS